LIVTFLITVTVEGFVVVGYSLWRKRPFLPLLLSSIFINLVTQSFLWVLLHLFFRHYLITLLIAEFLIWFMESIFLYYLPANRLHGTESILISLGMNLASFGAGWFLPI
jgi:hypothetical protein